MSPLQIPFPFPFSPLIHACAFLHFSESGVRFFEYVIHHHYPLDTSIIPEVMSMYSRLNATPRSLSLFHLLECPSDLSDGLSLFSPSVAAEQAQEVMIKCVEVMGDWQYAKGFFKTRLEEGDTQAKMNLLRACFNLDDNSEILRICANETDPSITQFRVAVMLNRFQFDEVLKTTRAMHYKFPVEADTTSSTLRLRFFLTISAVITQLHDKQEKLAQSTTERAIHTFSQVYMRSLRHADVSTYSSQPYLALLSLLKQTLTHSLSVNQMARIVKVLAKENSNSIKNWFDILVFQKSLAFCLRDQIQSSVELPHCSFHLQHVPKETLSERSNQFRGYFNILKQQGNDHALIRIGYAWSKLLLMEGQEKESVGVLKEVREVCERVDDEDGITIKQKCEKRLTELTASPPSCKSLSVSEIWCEMLMRDWSDSPTEEKGQVILSQLIEAFRGINEIASVTHYHFIYILFELLTHYSFSIHTQFSLPSLTPIFPLLIHALPSLQSPSITSLLSLISSNKELAAKFLLMLLAQEEILDPVLMGTLQRRVPNLVIEAEMVSRELRSIADSKLVRIGTFLDDITLTDSWTDYNREDFEVLLRGPNVMPLDEEITRELTLRLQMNWTISDVFLSF